MFQKKHAEKTFKKKRAIRRLLSLIKLESETSLLPIDQQLFEKLLIFQRESYFLPSSIKS